MAEEEPAEEEEPCNFQATDDCTPHVGPKGKVRVDALVWSVANTSTAPTIGEQQYGLGEKADGVFVIVKLNVKSEKDETATIASETVELSGR